MATIDWIGAALAVAQVSRVTYSAYTSGETYTLTINGKSITYTAIASTSADVWAGLQAAWEASTIAEFQEATATVDSGVYLTADTAGKPFTVTGSATGLITATVTEITAPTGPNHFNNAKNWEGGVLPGAGEHIRFRNSSVSLLYALENTGTDYGNILVESTFTGAIGLPAETGQYREYRPRFLKLGGGTNNFIVRIGQGIGSQPSLVFIDANAATCYVQVYGTGQLTSNERPVIIKNTDATSTFEIYSGFVQLDGDTAGSAATLKVIANQQSGAQASVLATETFACGAVTCLGGELEIRGSAASLDANGGAVVSVTSAATCPVVTAASGATVFWDSTAGVTTSATARGLGAIDFGRNGAAKAVAAATIFKDAKILDPLGIISWTTGVLLSGCTLQECTLDLGRNKTIDT